MFLFDGNDNVIAAQEDGAQLQEFPLHIFAYSHLSSRFSQFHRASA